MERDRGAVSHDLLVIGERGRKPLLLLYGVTVTDTEVTAQAYTVSYAVPRTRTLAALEHDNPRDRQWQPQRGGLRIRVPKLAAGHFLHESITFKRPRRA